MEKYLYVSQITSKVNGCSWQSKGPPKDVHVLFSRTCEYVTLRGGGDFADVVKDLEVGRLSWIISRWAQCHHRVLRKEKAGG